MTATVELEPRATTWTPIPAGRGRWRVTVHNRVYAIGPLPKDTVVAELPDARSVRLTQQWNQPAQLVFTLDGHSGSAGLATELTTDVYAWRWDEVAGQDVPMFRGVVGQSQDTLSADTHTVVFTCHDYLAMLARRMVTAPGGVTYTATDQDQIVYYLVNMARNQRAGSGASFSPGAFLPIDVGLVDPSGATRTFSGTNRDRTYAGQQNIGEALAQLAAVQGGFDFDVIPAAVGGVSAGYDSIRVFWQSQGVQRTTPQLVYGATVSALTRSFNSADYANYQRIIGNNGTATPGAAQFYSEAWNTDAVTGTAGAQGLWMNGDNASDVSIQSTLDQRAQGNLGRSGVVVPSYTLTLRPGVYSYGNPNMGDTVPLIIQSGRLAVDTMIRVLGIDYTVGDDGQEDVALTVGRPDVTLANLFTRQNADVNALARR
jgi:hypothetical protein